MSLPHHSLNDSDVGRERFFPRNRDFENRSREESTRNHNEGSDSSSIRPDSRGVNQERFEGGRSDSPQPCNAPLVPTFSWGIIAFPPFSLLDVVRRDLRDLYVWFGAYLLLKGTVCGGVWVETQDF